MGGVLNTLGQIGQAMAGQTGIGQSINRYRRLIQHHTQPQQGSTDGQLNAPGQGPMGTPEAMQDPMGDAAGSQDSQMSSSYTPQPQMDTGDDSGPMGYDNAAKGILVTKPIIARVGESGPEAIVPLNNQPGNKVRPDLLEGHLAPPHMPGVRYQKFKGYVNPAY